MAERILHKLSRSWRWSLDLFRCWSFSSPRPVWSSLESPFQAGLAAWLPRQDHTSWPWSRADHKQVVQLVASLKLVLTSVIPVPLPCEPHKPIQARTSVTANTTTSTKLTRKSKGAHLLPILTTSLSSRENWYRTQKTTSIQESSNQITLNISDLRKKSQHFPSTSRKMNTFIQRYPDWQWKTPSST